jgi:hypothetical protein
MRDSVGQWNGYRLRRTSTRVVAAAELRVRDESGGNSGGNHGESKKTLADPGEFRPERLC